MAAIEAKLYALLLLAVSLTLVAGEQFYVSMSLPKYPQMTNLLSNGLNLENGCSLQVQMTTQPENQIFYLAIMTTTQLQATNPNTSLPAPGYFFQYPTTLRFEFVNNISLSMIVPTYDQYNVVLYSSGVPSQDVSATIEFINPQSGQFQVNEAPMYPIVIGLLVVHLTLGLFWFPSFIKGWNNIVVLQGFLCLSLLLRCVELVLLTAYYGTISSTGVILSGLNYTASTCSIVSDAFYMSFLLLASLGWSIVRLFLSQREKQLFGGAFVIFVAFDAMYSFCGNSSLCSAFQLSLYVIKFLITFAVVVTLNTNIDWLRHTVASAYMATQTVASTKRITAKIRLLQRSRMIFFVYLVFPVTLLFVDFAVLDDSVTWMPYIIESAIELLILAYSLVLFRPQCGHFNFAAAQAEATAAATATATATQPLAATEPRQVVSGEPVVDSLSPIARNITPALSTPRSHEPIEPSSSRPASIHEASAADAAMSHRSIVVPTPRSSAAHAASTAATPQENSQ